MLLIVIMQGCTEPYALQTENFEDIIVVEATITNEYKNQEVKISRTYPLEETEPKFEKGATVFVTDSNGVQYDFIESNNIYVSANKFEALQNINYKLTVITSDGKTYKSRDEKITSTTELGTITTNAGTNSNLGNGVQIIANSNDSSDEIKYYRYTYEETNKIISPQWRAYMGVASYDYPVTHPNGRVLIMPWPYESKICYTTENSKDIILSNTALNSTNSNSTLVKFISDQDYKIANRYSIEVTLYNQSLASYNYYDALKKSSNQGNILSQNQPGFYSGNIKNVNNPNEKVIGFFDVTYASKKRIFFNFEDVFPNQSKPKYPYYCPEVTDANENQLKLLFCFCPPRDCPTILCSGYSILQGLKTRTKAVLEYETDINYTMANSQCIDCTTFSSNIKPSFWID